MQIISIVLNKGIGFNMPRVIKRKFVSENDYTKDNMMDTSKRDKNIADKKALENVQTKLKRVRRDTAARRMIIAALLSSCRKIQQSDNEVIQEAEYSVIIPRFNHNY